MIDKIKIVYKWNDSEVFLDGRCIGHVHHSNKGSDFDFLIFIPELPQHVRDAATYVWQQSMKVD